MREYHAEYRLGLRRTEAPAVVDARMDERRAEREALTTRGATALRIQSSRAAWISW
jgi:hypothetical protein